MVLFSFYYSHKPGGLNARLYRALRTLAAAGHTVHYASLDAPPNSELPGVNFHQIWFPTKERKGLLFWMALSIWLPAWLFGALLKIKPNKVITFGAIYSAWATPACALLNIPIVLFMRSLVFKNNEINNKPPIQRYFSNLLERFGIKGASKVVVMSNAMRAELSEFFGSTLDCAILPNEIPTEKPLEKGSIHVPLRIFASGVLDQRKNIGIIVDAVLSMPLNTVELRIAGDGAQLPELKAKASERSDIKFLGWLHNTKEELAFTDLVIHPALHEGVSNSILEALSLNVPLLVSDIPEHREFFSDAAIRFNPQDPSALAKILVAIVQDPASYQRLKSALAPVQAQLCFNWDKVLIDIILS